MAARSAAVRQSVSNAAARAPAAATRNSTRTAGGSAPRAAPSVSSSRDASVGRMINATNSEELSVMIRVSGRNLMNSPISPGQKASGTNAARVVAVEAMIGVETSPVAKRAAATPS